MNKHTRTKVYGIRLACLTIMALIIVTAFSVRTFAAAPKKTVIKSGTVTINSGETYEIPFNTTKKMIFTTVVKIDFLENEDISNVDVSEGGVRIKLIDSKGNTLQNDYQKLKGWGEYDPYNGWCVSDKYFQKSGAYTYVIKNSTDMNWKLKYSVNGFTGYSQKASLKKTKSVKRGDWVKIGTIGKGYPRLKSFNSSKKKVVKDYYIEHNGAIYVKGKAVGTSKVTIKLRNGKKYSTTVTVKPKDPDLYACLYDYNTRNNYFKVKIKNNGDRNVTIIRSGGKVINVNYKTYDRKFKSSKSVTIKPGKTQYIKFYCKGTTTWNDYQQYTLYAKFKSEGKTYTWHVWDTDSVIKKGKKWYSSYWNQDLYNEWNPNVEVDDEDYDEDYDDEDYDDEDYDDEDYDDEDYDDEDYDDEDYDGEDYVDDYDYDDEE